MTGIYGAGNAFNLRCRPRPLSLPAQRRMGPPIIMQQDTLVVQQDSTVSQGRGGGFLGGFLGGLLGGVVGSFLDGTEQVQQAQQQPGEDSGLSYLRGLFPKYTFQSAGDGNYTVTNPNDYSQTFTGTTQQVVDKIKEWATKPQGETESTGSTVSTESTGSTESTESTGSTESTESTGSTESTDQTPDTHGGGAGRVNVPSGWYRASADKNDNMKPSSLSQKFPTGTDAGRVVDEMLKTKMDYLGTTEKAALRDEIIKNNPSVFANGKVKEGADWSKLDIPSIDYIKSKYMKGDATFRRDQTVSYTPSDQNTPFSTGLRSNTVGAKRAARTAQAQGARATQGVQNKNAPQSGKISITPGDFRSKRNHVASVTIGGKTYTTEVHFSATVSEAQNRAKTQLQEQIRADGYTNVTLS